MSEHPQEHEAWLAEILSGELDPNAPENQRRLDACAVCRAEFESLQGVLGEIERAEPELGSELDRIREEVVGGPTAPWVLEQLNSGGNAGSQRRAPPSGRRAMALAAALTLVIGGWLAWRLREPRPDIPMGREIEIVAPVGEVDAIESFRWRYDRRRGETFEIEVLVDAARVHVERDIVEQHWEPSPETTAKWRGKIQWMLTVRSDRGSIVTRSSLVAVSLSSH
ncbi:MAG: hypothetical protein KDC38_15455 [Planctomycetes bacterium]|nr:hypothetical protein [Planctomycetota bacterium]